MKKITLYIIIIIAFCSCQQKKEETNITSQEMKNIDEIVEAIIIQDSLNVFSKSEDSTMFCSELRKLKIHIPPKKKNNDFILMPPSEGKYITSFIPFKIKGYTFFSSKDSLYLLAQNLNPEKLAIEKKLINKWNNTTIEKIKTRRKNKQKSRFYEMTIPVFSVDRQSAYVELDYQCGGLCGSGQDIFLKKINGKWKIIVQWQSWIS
ncbi:hypothetical protein KHA90_00710 [Flavobacterium psychroterrae]|uniref:Uncharacterized protein n=1 Tax=Flavobacterium psychroterrae TaxID=2133767 RepID=A0ABS5P5H0_9FLAO|nr:hypothetical protein [Flavobacterium psychroterrae]MBS7229530.1 hypothetical protein [Flavobacterium psychroterrae]